MFLGPRTYLGRVSRYLSQIGEERQTERGEKCRKKRKKRREVSRHDGRKFDIRRRERGEGGGGGILKFTPGRI